MGQDDLFPYRIEFRRRAAKQGRGVDDGQGEMLPILSVNLFEVQIGAAIDPQLFIYHPDNAVINDTTSSLIKTLNGK